MTLASEFKSVVRGLRSWPVVNRPLTGVLRAVVGGRSEFLIRHLPRNGEVRATLPNGRELILETQGDDWMPNQIFWRGWDGYETETARAFYRLATSARCTLDVGAYVGFFAILAGHANPSSQVIAFEPLPTVHHRLVSNVAANGLGNVRCEQKAVGRVSRMSRSS